jgi:PTS system mannose-specific IID component
MAENKITLDKSDLTKVWWRSQFLQASWNYERMQNIGWCYAMIPVMQKLYSSKEEQTAFLKRHLEFFNTHPYVAAPVWGVELALEESRANGAPVDDAAIQGVKIGMMGPLAGVGDPIFWGTLRPVLGAFAASLALTGSILGPIIFFVLWNAIRMAFLYYTMEFGYKQGASITEDLSGGLLQKITLGASILGMFIMGVLIPRWTSIDLSSVVFANTDYGSALETFPALEELVNTLNGVGGTSGVTPSLLQDGYSALTTAASNGMAIVNDAATYADAPWRLVETTTLQSVLDSLLPGILPLLLTFLCMYLLKKKVNPIAIIFGLFAVGIIGALIGLW